jgi:hypothetical protein
MKAGIAAVRDFLAGRSAEAKAPHASDKATRQEVAAELVEAMAGKGDRRATTDDQRKTSADAVPQSDDSQSKTGNQVIEQEQERARRLFVEHGYFDEAVEALRGAEAAADRVVAARALGLVGSQRGTAHLIAAMFDDDAEVRSAAEEALARIGDPTATKTSPKHVEKKVKVTEASAAPATGTPTEPGVQIPAASRESGSAKGKSAEEGGRTTRASGRATTSASPTQQDSAPVEQATSAKAQTQPVREQSKPQAKSKAAATAKPRIVEPQVSVQPVAQADVPEDPSLPEDEKQLFRQEQAARKALHELEQKLHETLAALNASHNEARWRASRESKLKEKAAARQREEEELRKQAEEAAAARRREEEEQRKQAEEVAARRRLQEAEALKGEETARAKAETEERRLVEEQTRLWLEAASLRQTAQEHARNRMSLQVARHEAAEAAERKEAQSKRQQAEAQHSAAVQQLRTEEENLRKASDEAAKHRAEVEAARERAERDAEKLLEAQARMRTAEEMRAKAEAQRVKLETELRELVETEERRLTEARRHAQEEDARLQEEARAHTEAEQKRLADLEDIRAKSEQEHKQRLERERELLGEIDSLRIADAEARKRIAEAEAREHTAEQAYMLVADQVQRFEAEAHAAALAEEQILVKLETARRNVANEAQARTEQEKRIKEEIEMFRRLEEEERPRIEALSLQRAAAEALLQELRERFNAEEEARISAQKQIDEIEAQRRQAAARTFEAEPPEDTFEDLAPAMSAVEETIPEDVNVATVTAAPLDFGAGVEVPAAIASYLHSVDPYKRAAAVAELARSNSNDAFALISRCFDDHSPHVRNAAARALRKLDPHKTVDLFNRAIDEGSEERRRNIGTAIAASGVAAEAIDNLISESREDTYNALSVLFVMAKAGELDPLVQAIEEHPTEEVCRASIKLLTLSGNSEVGDAALQRRVMGVAAGRQKANGARNEIPDFRLRIAEVEVKRAMNSQQPTSRKPTPDSEEQTALSGNE